MKSARTAKKPRAKAEREARRPAGLLPSSEETWRILEDLPVAVAVATLDDDPRLLFLNKQFIKTFGYTLEDIPTQTEWAQLAYPDPDYRRKVFARWNEAVERASRELGSVESMEFRVTAKDGCTRDILFNAIVLGDTIQASLSDLTARRDAERALQSAREELERTAYEVTENIPAGTYTMILPPGGEMARFSFMSSRFLEICGLDRKAAEENPFNAFACVHPEDYDEWVRKNGECFEKKVPFSEECRIINGGEIRWIHAESVPRDLPDGSVVWEGVLTDITRRKNAEVELRSAREKLQRSAYELTANIPVGTYVIEFDTAGRPSFTFTSERWLAMLGLRAEDVSADPSLAFEAVHPEERAEFQRLNAEVIAKRTPFFWEGRIVVGGRISWVTIESIPRERPDGGTIWEGVMTDITRRKNAEAELAALREAEKTKERQVRENLETKLRASLVAAAAAPERLVMDHEEEASRGDSRVSGYLRSLAGEAQQVVATIEKMKSLMRNTGTDKAPIDLRDLADSAVLYAGSFARPVKAQISFARPDRRAVVTADADQLQIALNNLLRNAIEAVAELPGRRRREIRIEVRHGKDRIELVVGDSGRGLSEGADQDHLPESTKPGGTGLGLFIVRTALENHGGKLEIGRSPLGGAEARMVLPKTKRA